MPGATDSYADHPEPGIQGSPLALDSEQARTHVKDQVVSPVLTNRTQDSDARLGGFQCDRQLRDVPLLVRTEHEHMFAQPVERVRRGA